MTLIKIMDYMTLVKENETLERQLAQLERKLDFWKERANEYSKLYEKTLSHKKPDKKICKQCNAPFEQNVKGREKKFCSNACRQSYWRTEQSYKSWEKTQI